MADRLALTVQDGVAELRFVRPAAHNAIDYAFAAALPDVAHAVRDDPAVRALVIVADGPSFSVGGDLQHIAAAGPDGLSDELVRMIEPYHEGLATLDELRVPVVTAGQGPVAGGALGFLYVADAVLLAPGARLVPGFDRLGLSGDGGGTFHLPRLVGLRRATELAVRGRALDAETAVAWGLASEVVAGDLTEAAHAEARRLSHSGAAGELRGLLRTPPARAALAAELDAMRRLGAAEAAQQAIASFVSAR